MDSNREDTRAFKINCEEIEEVDDFIYLGSTITNKGNSTPEIRRQLAMARERGVGAMGYCLPRSYIYGSESRQMNGGCTPLRCGATEGS